MHQPLQGIHVVDASRILAGPLCTQVLADLGADVLKLEPADGDATRSWGPPFEFGDHGDSAYFRSCNRGKRSERFDLGTPQALARLHELLATADVYVENFRPGSLAKHGLEPAQLRMRHPRLVVGSIRAFASDTAAAMRAGYDFLMQAEAGWMAITGPVDGPPMKVGVALVDVLTGLFLANGIQSALLRRERTGEGAHVEVPLYEAALAGLVNVGASALMTGTEARRFGNAHPNIVPYQSFDAADGPFAIAVGNDAQFAALCDAFGLRAVFDAHPAWATNPGRVAHRAAVVTALDAAFAGLPRATILARCEAIGVPAGPVRGVAEALLAEGEGRLHRAVVSLTDADGKSQQGIATPILLDGVRAVNPRTPPTKPR